MGDKMLSSDSFSIANLLSTHPPIRSAAVHDDPLSHLRKLSSLPDSASQSTESGPHLIHKDHGFIGKEQLQPIPLDSGAVSTSSDIVAELAVDSADSGQSQFHFLKLFYCMICICMY